MILRKNSCFIYDADGFRKICLVLGAHKGAVELTSFVIDKHRVDSFLFPEHYDLEEILSINPRSISHKKYDEILKLYRNGIDQMNKVLYEEAFKDIPVALDPSRYYTDGVYIYQIEGLRDGRYYYKFVRIDYDYLGSNWTGDQREDGFLNGIRLISEETRLKVMKMKDELIQTLMSV